MKYRLYAAADHLEALRNKFPEHSFEFHPDYFYSDGPEYHYTNVIEFTRVMAALEELERPYVPDLPLPDP